MSTISPGQPGATPLTVNAPARPLGAAAPRATNHPVPPAPVRVALLGNPNTGKTTLFNRLCGLRHKTSNFPGTTLEARIGRVRVEGQPALRVPAASCCESAPAPRPRCLDASMPSPPIDLIDLPGIYSLELDQLEAQVCREVLAGRRFVPGMAVVHGVGGAGSGGGRGDGGKAEPDALCVVADATNLLRNLMFVGEALRRRLPTVIAVNMIDIAQRHGLHVDAPAIGRRLGCGVVCVSARSGRGLPDLRAALAAPRIPSHTPPGDEAGLRAWAESIYAEAASAPDAAGEPGESLHDRLDRAFTHPVLGVVVFALVMTALFWSIFSLARFPMEWIGMLFEVLGGAITAAMPEGVLRDLLANGIVAGVSGTVVFLPQICLLFFLISLLEDTGYLARAAFVMDRVLRPFGLPGHAFVPLLSSHACALPGIMACRAIPDRRERLATILVAPFMTCSARLPVYVLLTTLLFRGRPLLQALAFVSCYALGIAAGVVSALVARRTILRGRARPMALELPTYKWPSLGTALSTTADRALVFLKKAGTNIMMICIVLWWLGSYPRTDPPPQAVALRERAAAVATASGPDDPAVLLDEADRLERIHQKANSFAGRLGHAIEPVVRPLGYDWQLGIGLVTSFAAREVFVSTMTVVLAGEESDDAQGSVLERMADAKRDDGVTPVFTTAAAWSLLVYYVLAMQCLPTLAVTAREAGGVRWAVLQLGWMSGLAYLAALGVNRIVLALS